MRVSIAGMAGLIAWAAAGAGAGAAELSGQLDVVAPLINAQDIEALAGPGDPAGIIAGLDGQWFPLNNFVRNWDTAGAGLDEENLSRSLARNCSGETDASTFYEVTGETSFSVREVLREYDTDLTLELVHVDGRHFSVLVDEEDLIRSYGKEDAPETEKAEIREMAALFKDEGVELWRPSEDILVVSGTFGVDVTGRCPPR